MRTGDNLDAARKKVRASRIRLTRLARLKFLSWFSTKIYRAVVIDYVTELSNQVFENSDVDLRLVVADMIQISLRMLSEAPGL